MGRGRNRLTVKQLKSLPKGTHADGVGLWFKVNSPTSRQWIYRYTFAGKQRTIGLGSFPEVTLAEARQSRDKWATVVRKGENPVEVKRREKAQLLHKAQDTSLKVIADEAYEAIKHTLKDDGGAGRWFSPLKVHVLPMLGDLAVEDISQVDIQQTLKPIWHTKPDTARKAIGRLQKILEYAENKGLSVDVDVIRKAKGLLGNQLPVVTHHSAMPWRDVPDYYASLTGETQTQLGLRFLILNPGPRTGPIRFLQLSQIKDDVWTIPGETMKGTKHKTPAFKVPLSSQSLSLLNELKPFERNGYLMSNKRGTGVVSDAIFSKYMRDSNVGYVPHGFRASFKTWALENGHNRDITELCLAHKVYSKVEAAYVRTESLKERRELMQAWSDYVSSKV